MRSSSDAAVVAEGLRKRYGKTRALAGLDLRVETGSVHGVLGPNGAGKTTAVRILTTLLQADGGRATVLGLDVATQAQQIRSQIGLTGQYAAVDEYLTGLENLDMFGRLYRLPARIARLRAAELLERFDLVEAGRRPVKTYSGGMRRRLDLAASLVMQPRLLFLDEPTTGLDPRSRIGMWGVISELVRDGTTVLLTTQYLEEADQLADTISVIDGGRVIAEGTADDLKSRVGGDRLTVLVAPGGDLAAAVEALRRHGIEEPVIDAQRWAVTVAVGARPGMLPVVVRDLDAAGVIVADLEVQRPTLDDVFLSLTGKGGAPAAAPAPTPPHGTPTPATAAGVRYPMSYPAHGGTHEPYAESTPAEGHPVPAGTAQLASAAAAEPAPPAAAAAQGHPADWQVAGPPEHAAAGYGTEAYPAAPAGGYPAEDTAATAGYPQEDPLTSGERRRVDPLFDAYPPTEPPAGTDELARSA